MDQSQRDVGRMCRKGWLEAMERAVHPVHQHHVWVDVTRHNANLPPLAIKSPECLGLLYQVDRNKDVWVQHYCVLKDGCIYFYAGIRSTHALEEAIDDEVSAEAKEWGAHQSPAISLTWRSGCSHSWESTPGQPQMHLQTLK
uniref:uncharacterized protein pdzph1 isoform X4 n=1 Tax=Pristiophorus japonicus TaxID=55135 RepID=UPI00398F59FA